MHISIRTDTQGSQMPEYAFPHKPYDEVESLFIREQICQGSFRDLPHRRYVNELV